MATPRTVVIAILPIKKGTYLAVDGWFLEGHHSFESLREDQLHDFDRDDLFSLEFMVHPNLAHLSTIESMGGNAIWQAEDAAKVRIASALGVNKIVGYKLFADFSIDDMQLVRQHFSNAKAVTAEQFHAATGEWPSGSAELRLETIIMPTTGMTMVDDLVSLERDGWIVATTFRKEDAARGATPELFIDTDLEATLRYYRDDIKRRQMTPGEAISSFDKAKRNVLLNDIDPNDQPTFGEMLRKNQPSAAERKKQKEELEQHRAFMEEIKSEVKDAKKAYSARKPAAKKPAAKKPAAKKPASRQTKAKKKV